MRIHPSPTTLSGPVSYRELRETLDQRMDGMQSEIERDLPAWDTRTEERLAALRRVADSLSPESSSEVKKAMRTALWELRQALESGAAESLGAHPGSRPEVRKALEKVRTIALDNSFEGAERYPREEVAVRPGIDAVPNFRQVAPGILRGGQPTQEGMDWLVHERGVKTAVDLRGSDRASPFCQWDEPRWPAVEQVNIEVEDYQTPSPEELRRFLELADRAGPDNPLFVHCKAGIGRTGTMIACWRITQGWTADQAIERERLGSYDASFRQEEFVRDFERQWKEQRA